MGLSATHSAARGVGKAHSKTTTTRLMATLKLLWLCWMACDARTPFSFKGVSPLVKYVGSGVLTDSARAFSLPGCSTFVEIQGVALYGPVLRK